MAPRTSGTISIVTANRPYSVFNDLAGWGPNVSSLDSSGPAKISTWDADVHFDYIFLKHQTIVYMHICSWNERETPYIISFEHVTEFAEKVSFAQELSMNEDGLSGIAGSGITALGVFDCKLKHPHHDIWVILNSEKHTAYGWAWQENTCSHVQTQYLINHFLSLHPRQE